MWRGVFCVSVACCLALDSNTIRSSKETTTQSSEQPARSHDDEVNQAVQRQTETTFNSHRRPSSPCSTSSCSGTPKGGCSNRAQRRGQTSQDRETDRQTDIAGLNVTKAPEMSSCVRSGDCAAGLCCARYLTGKRCQRIPTEGEACSLKGSKTKLRRNLGRCDCGTGLSCTSVSRAEPGKAKGQGVCLPSQSRGQRKTRHSGKKRRTAETGC